LATMLAGVMEVAPPTNVGTIKRVKLATEGTLATVLIVTWNTLTCKAVEI